MRTRPSNAGEPIIERVVQTAQTNQRWDWFERGEPLPEEDVAGYSARRKRDRLNEASVMALLGRLGAHPWQSEFYALPGQVGLIERPRARSCTVRTIAEVVAPPTS